MEQQQVVTLTSKQKALNEEVKVVFEAIRKKLGTACLKSEHIYVDVSPRALELVRKFGTRIGFGWWSLEAYFGEMPAGTFTSLPEGTKVWKDRAKKAAPASTEFSLEGLPTVNVFAQAEEAAKPPVAVEAPKEEVSKVATKPVKANKKASKVVKVDPAELNAE